MYHLLKLFREVAPHPPGRGIRIGELGMRRLQFLQSRQFRASNVQLSLRHSGLCLVGRIRLFNVLRGLVIIMCGAVAGILIALGGILRGFVGGCRTFLCRGKGRLSSIQHNLCIGYFLLPLRLCTFGSSNRLVLQGIQCILGRIVPVAVGLAGVQNYLLCPDRRVAWRRLPAVLLGPVWLPMPAPGRPHQIGQWHLLLKGPALL